MNSKKIMDPYLFTEGANYQAYKFFGVHKEKDRYVFRVWAPRAEKVFLVGDFNGWQENIPMSGLFDLGVWEAGVSGDNVDINDKYKYKIYSGDNVQYKADPFCTQSAMLPETASLIGGKDEHVWLDSGWLNFRKRYTKSLAKLPMNVYQLHVGTWMRHVDGSYMSFDEIAAELAPYVKQMGYTHVQLTSIFEPSDDGSLMIGTCSYFSASAKHGGNAKLKCFVDKMHEAGVGIILEWDPAYFANTEYSLARFDGDHLYESVNTTDTDGRLMFDLSRNEVRSFLISSADYWIREFHIDGLFVRSVFDILSCDRAGHSDGAQFLEKLTRYVKHEFGDVILIADYKDTQSVCNVGFDIVRDFRWTENTLFYISNHPNNRMYEHSRLNVSMTYAFDQKYMLSVSRDDVSGGNLSFVDKMPGDYWQKFANARAYHAYMMTHPGKKLSYMGNEIGQFREWEIDNETEWFLLEYETHAKFQRCIAELNHIYLREPALWSEDDSWRGFEWIEPDDAEQSILSYRRVATDSSELIVLINFTPEVHRDFLLGTDKPGVYREIFNSDDTRFGGSGVVNAGLISSMPIAASRCKNSIRISVPPLAAVIFKAE